MKRFVLYGTLICCSAFALKAQDKIWSMNDCMKYAVENSPGVRRAAYEYDTYKGEYNSAVAAFFPSLTIYSSAQYNFGRAIDPETNTYINTTTFNNNYEGNSRMPIFSGGQLVNQWRLAKNNRQMGLNDVQKEKDDLALNTMEAFANVVYYRGTLRFSQEKFEESKRSLYKVKRQEELGIKGKADVAQMEATVAGDDYTLTQQQNLYTKALLKLKEYMNFPYGVELVVDTVSMTADYIMPRESVEDIFDYAQDNNPTALQAKYKQKSARLKYLAQRGKLLPTVSLQAGAYTGYFENLMSQNSPIAFKSQLKNNVGEYLSLNITIPLFDRLVTYTEVRRARNNMRIAAETQNETLRQLQTAIESSVADRDGYAKESMQLEKKLGADELAYQLTLRKYEEGLSSAIELQTSANTLIETKAGLLQRRLMYELKSRQVEYYKGNSLIINN